ncbi:uncharacterized protein [Cicer arietinum]|uniref:Protein MAIN-LIKE 1-like n=1 Tax=Cicer arietinum TaxID=3827 RepID=A0A1S3E581_CICAR|nr:protein MAIN-LIKE 1-like [Cicer arietinum]
MAWSTILTDKSHTLVDAKYLPLSRHLDGTNKYAWGTVALLVLYDYLSYACCYDTKQLGGYITLLQYKVHEYKRMIDALTHANVIWRPWENHRDVTPFVDVMFYIAHLRLCSTVVKYLLERCFR